MSNSEKVDSGAAEGARRATGEAPESSGRRGKGRWSSKRKAAVVVELLRGEDIESLSRRDAVTAATLSAWREAFLCRHRRQSAGPTLLRIYSGATSRAASGPRRESRGRDRRGIHHRS